jgi:hypothetical protein
MPPEIFDEVKGTEVSQGGCTEAREGKYNSFFLDYLFLREYNTGGVSLEPPSLV